MTVTPTHEAIAHAIDQLAAEGLIVESLELDKRTLGEVVFSTSDDALEAGERELALFDRQLAGDEASFDRYLPSVGKVGFEDDYELVAFDEELRQRGLAGT